MLSLDTHILLYALSGELRVKEREILSGDRWGISDIVLWEIAKLVQRGRVDLEAMVGTAEEVDALLEASKE